MNIYVATVLFVSLLAGCGKTPQEQKTTSAVVLESATGDLAAPPNAEAGEAALTIAGPPTLFAPIGQSFDKRPLFRWSTAIGAVTYRLWISLPGSDNVAIFDQPGLRSTSFRLPHALVEDKTYRWWVRAYGANGRPVTAWSRVAQFVYRTKNASSAAIPSFDVDGDGRLLSLNDGLMIMRYFAGQDSVSAGLANPQGQRPTEAAIRNFLDSREMHAFYDVDANGLIDSATDGQLIVRFMAGFTGPALVRDIVGKGARRTSPVDIVRFLSPAATPYRSTLSASPK